ncbi:hypothetical protein SY88_02475 [Clostridiales bacterium PH28_bin88]|nr:hypothetical protein SY88_02475 [Clostridiales bacterium PH28_bin88]
MLCQECKQRPATVHITKIVNSEKTHLSLCEDCAREHQQQWGFGFEPSFSIHKFLAGLLDYDPAVAERAERGSRQRQQCEQCGLTYDQFAQTGKLGCDKCYQYFSGRLEPLLRRVHGSVQHVGKVPRRAGGSIRLKQEMKRLRTELQQLVAQEEFEKAAQVRDRLRELEKKIEA